MKKLFYIILLSLLLLSCTTTIVIKESKLVLVTPPRISNIDKQDFPSFLHSSQKSLKYFKKIKEDKVFSYGEQQYSKQEMIASMLLLQAIIQNSKSNAEVIKNLKEKFLWFKSPGRKDDGKVLFTGYFEPLFLGSRTSDAIYNIPIYPIPKNLRVLDLGLFRKNLINHTIVYRLSEQQEIIPYYNREEIIDGVLREKTLPIAWMKDITDLFFLQIQGSGILQTPSGELIRIGYAGANGRNYSSVGKILIKENLIPASKMSMSAIRNYLDENPLAKQTLLNKNESYVFFRLLELEEGPYGALEVALTPQNSLAVDYRIFPDGAIAYIDTNAPDCERDCQIHKPLQKFVMIQDTGGAIRGFGRADLFWGRGELAQKKAGFMQHLGDLFVLVAKKKYLK